MCARHRITCNILYCYYYIIYIRAAVLAAGCLRDSAAAGLSYLWTGVGAGHMCGELARPAVKGPPQFFARF